MIAPEMSLLPPPEDCCCDNQYSRVVGERVGTAVGVDVGGAVGVATGDSVDDGFHVGATVGTEEGALLGDAEGVLDGDAVGVSICDRTHAVQKKRMVVPHQIALPWPLTESLRMTLGRRLCTQFRPLYLLCCECNFVSVYSGELGVVAVTGCRWLIRELH